MYEMRTWSVAASVRQRKPEHDELWRAMCAELERVVADPRWEPICASGEGTSPRRGVRRA